MNLWQIDIDFRYTCIQVFLLIQKKILLPRIEPGPLDQELDALPTELLWLIECNTNLRQANYSYCSRDQKH